MKETILALNAGSSSVKFSLYGLGDPPDNLSVRCRGEVEGLGHDAHLAVRDATGRIVSALGLGPTATQESALGAVLDNIEKVLPGHTLVAVGHRVVHGGDAFDGPVAVNEQVLRILEGFVPWVPSHQPHNLAAIKVVAGRHPNLCQVACFDTAFHQSQPALARAYALPRALSDSGLRRYGFHGLSYEYIASVLPVYAGAAADGRVVVAHLGHGASMCAMRGRHSVATTMGFSALDGLPMGRRCGALDPGLVPYLVCERGLSIEEVEDVLYRRSGLFGVSGISDDMRDLLDSDAPAASEAVELFCYRAGRELGSLAAAIEGLDVLVFTGGIGEHAAAVRAKVCAYARWLGVQADQAANARGGPRLTPQGLAPAAFVIPTDEDLMIARHTLHTVHSTAGPSPAPVPIGR
jgi:acetate kinase